MDDTRWRAWERLISTHGIVIDRPKGTAHPRFPDMIYPVDYGYLPGTIGGDSAGIDIFAGGAETGLIGIVQTHDALKGDRETKLLWNVTSDEVDAITRLLNTGLMTATLILRPRAEHDPRAQSWAEFFDLIGWLEEPYDDFTIERPMNVMGDDRIPFADVEDEDLSPDVRDS